MNIPIDRLTAADYPEAIALLDLAFSVSSGPHDFQALLPGIYQPTDRHMRCNYAIRIDGAIRAMVGVFPIAWRPGGLDLPIAGIGGVCCHPDFREQKLVTRLLARAVDDMSTGGTPLSFLGGQRQRYGYCGYEVAGNLRSYSLTSANLRHTFTDTPAVTLRPLADCPQALPAMQRWYTTLPLACDRDAVDFPALIRNWLARVSVGFVGDRPVGYLIATGNGALVTELAGESDAILVDMLRVHMAARDNATVTVRHSGISLSLERRLDQFAESVACGSSGNWRIMDWPRVLSTLFAARALRGPLVAGAVRVAIDGGPVLALQVTDGTATVTVSADAADLTVDPFTATRLFFGPLRPSDVIALPAAAAILDAWCPLPLAISRADTC